MNNLKQTEKIMMLAARCERADYETAFKKVVDVFRFIDIQEHSNHCKILNILYEVKDKNLTYEGVATKMHISDNALRRYRRSYAQWFIYFLNLQPQNVA
ncbi:MAG: hypothetical protein K2N23_06895 [Clostridia bacterium]|nr:hypothetical protein [Clostridia bacterium]